MKHIVISGAKGSGKSALIEKLLLRNALPVCGFVTRKADLLMDGAYPICIYPAAEKKRILNEECCVGLCNRGVRKAFPEIFDTLGVEYLNGCENGLVVMDELGMLETQAEVFKKAVMKTLDRDRPVIAAIKNRRDIAFLNAIRNHPKVCVCKLTEENREELYEELLPIILAWNREFSSKRRTKEEET